MCVARISNGRPLRRGDRQLPVAHPITRGTTRCRLDSDEEPSADDPATRSSRRCAARRDRDPARWCADLPDFFVHRQLARLDSCRATSVSHCPTALASHLARSSWASTGWHRPARSPARHLRVCHQRLQRGMDLRKWMPGGRTSWPISFRQRVEAAGGIRWCSAQAATASRRVICAARRIVVRAGMVENIGRFGACDPLSAPATPRTVPPRDPPVTPTTTTTAVGTSPTTANGSPGVTDPSSMPPCADDQLRSSALQYGAAGGAVSEVIAFTNISSEPCSLTGYPGVAALDNLGVQVEQARRQLNAMLGGQYEGTQPQTVPLGPGELGIGHRGRLGRPTRGVRLSRLLSLVLGHGSRTRPRPRHSPRSGCRDQTSPNTDSPAAARSSSLPWCRERPARPGSGVTP